MAVDHADLIPQKRDRLFDAAAHARVAPRQQLILRHQRARELPAALHQRLHVPQLLIGQRRDAPAARRMAGERARQLRQQPCARPFPFEQPLGRARNEIAGMMRIDHHDRQSHGLQRARHFELEAAGRLQDDERRRPFGNRIGQRFDAERLVPVSEDHAHRRHRDFDDLGRDADADADLFGRQRLAFLPDCTVAHVISRLRSTPSARMPARASILTATTVINKM
ncbi:hypothetical protein [Burkholderia ubonensis]|uniref:hypothetical protein n=1 Tax=Burkholderia ubonensis TaxID=101571 RepID=UPI0007588B14|nr:hypothetical protein [Burkholderia ubonensis]KWN15693.1 hypothetical protein WM21_12055 [Burkholderia ubonensis]